MPNNSLNRFHIALMEEVLPVGIAIIDRAKQGGLGKLVEELTSSADMIETLRGEGAKSAQDLRDRLDQVRLGLGNPAVEVNVSKNDPDLDNINNDSLTVILQRINEKLFLIQEKLDHHKDVNL